MRRTILVHLNVETPHGDDSTPDEVADRLLSAMEDAQPRRAIVVADGRSGRVPRPRNCTIVYCPLAEEVQ